MGELWDIYDTNKKKTGRTAERDVYHLKEGEYHIVVEGIIINSKNEILITKRAPHKKFGLMWECNGGSVLLGETSLDGMIRELREELGVKFDKKDAIYLKEVRRDKVPPNFKDLWLFKKDIDNKEITFPDGESIDYKWVTIEEFINMCNNKEIVPTIDFGLEEYNQALDIIQGKSYPYINSDMIKEKSCGCVIIEGEKVLLIQQNDEVWGFSKGHVEQGETEAETAIGEVKEETNLDVEIDKNKRYTLEYITDNGIFKQVVLFVARKIGGEERRQESEIKSMKWLNYEDAIKTITYDNTRELLKRIWQEKSL